MRIAILGSTGSIGQSALSVIRNHASDFEVVALSTNSNIELLEKQIEEFHPECICVNDVKKAGQLEPKIKSRGVKLLCGESALAEIARKKDIDKVLLAVTGASALEPLLSAIDSGNDIALANKEAMVMAGSIITRRAKIKNVKIIPIDSEQSAIWQCLEGRDRRKVRMIYLTASGGPFRKFKKKQLESVSINKVLKHPRWKMGKKISVDSATLMNKGLEFLETMFLFDMPRDKIRILIHPEAIIHSMVEFTDGVVMAQLSVPDMRIPIQYALSYPDRFENNFESISFSKIKNLSFEEPDYDKFPCLGLAFRAACELGTAPAVLNAADEVATAEFLKGRITFTTIPKVIEKVLNNHHNTKSPNLADILNADKWARIRAGEVIEKLG